jgi:hypothetical protein
MHKENIVVCGKFRARERAKRARFTGATCLILVADGSSDCEHTCSVREAANHATRRDCAITDGKIAIDACDTEIESLCAVASWCDHGHYGRHE